jgi:hypothetical protein
LERGYSPLSRPSLRIARPAWYYVRLVASTGAFVILAGVLVTAKRS